MSFRHRAVGLTALAQAIASCTVPGLGLQPSVPPAKPAADEAVPVTETAPPPAAPPAPSLTPVTGSGQAAPALHRLRVAGRVWLAGAPVVGARLSLIDLRTGGAIAARPWTAARSLRLQSETAPRTDAAGRFELEVPALAPEQIVKLVASANGKSFVTLFTGRGESLGAPLQAAEAPAPGGASVTTLALDVTTATTAVAIAFQGIAKLVTRIEPAGAAPRVGGDSEASSHAFRLAAATAVTPSLLFQRIQQLAAFLGPATDDTAIIDNVDENGDLADVDAFRSAVARAGIFDRLYQLAQEQLRALAGAPLAGLADTDPVTASDFPLDRVTISSDGQLIVPGHATPLTLGQGSYEPTPSRNRSRSRRAAEPAPFRLLKGLPGTVRGIAAYDAQTCVVAIDDTMRALTLATMTFGEDHVVGGEDSYAVAGDPDHARAFVGRQRSLYKCPMPYGSGSSEQLSSGYPVRALAIGRTHLYTTTDVWLTRVWLTDTNQGTHVQVGGAPYAPPGSGHWGLAVDDSGASPTLYVGNMEGQVFAVVDGGATHTLLASDLGDIRGIAYAAPTRTLYLASITAQSVISLDVDTRATATVTLDQPFTPGHGPWGVTLSRDGKTLFVTESQLPS
jgi:hypothetical protein